MAAPRDYLVLADRTRGASAGRVRADLEARLGAVGGWRRAALLRRGSVWVHERAPLRVSLLPQGAGILLGEVFEASEAPAEAALEGVTGLGVTRLANALCRARWGRYIAILEDEAGPWLLRDPSGALEALTWSTREGVLVAASGLDDLSGSLLPPRLSLAWDRIAGYLALPSAASEVLFDGLHGLAPGELARIGADKKGALVWRPSRLAMATPPPLAEARQELLRRVDACTAALCGGHDSLLVELSGGLDSSIVAGALGATGLAPRVAQWVNRVGDRAEGDERRYAEAVTVRLSAPLTTAPKPMLALDEADLAELAAATWPAINGADPARDRDMTTRLLETGARAIVSGQGGDAVFFQMPSGLVCAEVVAREGWRALRSDEVLNIARRLRRPVWPILWEAWQAGRAKTPPPSRASPLLARGLRDAKPPLHPWSEDAQSLPPARQLQVQAIAYSHLHRGDARRRRAGDLIYPLLAQPVVELCLSIPVAALAAGLPDRPFARQAFAERVPPEVLHRKTKGALTAYFARLVALSGPMLRPYLLDGCLASAGVLDRAAVAAALQPAQLIWAPRPVEILQAAMTEAWVRHWQGRIPDSLRSPRA